MSNKVSRLPMSDTYTPEQALDAAKALEPTDVVVLGYDAEEDMIMVGSRMTRAETLWLLEQARCYLLDT